MLLQNAKQEKLDLLHKKKVNKKGEITPLTEPDQESVVHDHSWERRTDSRVRKRPKLQKYRCCKREIKKL